jgi:hypothetical protein
MKTTNETPAAAPDSRAALIASGLASFRATVDEMNRALSVSILYGSGFAVIMREPYPSGNGFCTRALARVDPATRVYSHDAPRCFPALDLLSDRFAGLCLFSPDAARRVIEAQRASDYPKGTTFEARHIRDIQKDRLEMAREMVETLEKCAAALPAEERAAFVSSPPPGRNAARVADTLAE